MPVTTEIEGDSASGAIEINPSLDQNLHLNEFDSPAIHLTQPRFLYAVLRAVDQ